MYEALANKSEKMITKAAKLRQCFKSDLPEPLVPSSKKYYCRDEFLIEHTKISGDIENYIEVLEDKSIQEGTRLTFFTVPTIKNDSYRIEISCKLKVVNAKKFLILKIAHFGVNGFKDMQKNVRQISNEKCDPHSLFALIKQDLERGLKIRNYPSETEHIYEFVIGSPELFFPRMDVNRFREID